jgi:acyl carrier protein
MRPVEIELRQFIVNNFLYGKNFSLADMDSFLDAGIIDSTGVLELISFLERTYHIEIDDEDLIPENLDSITNLAAFLRRKMPATATAVELSSAVNA